MLAISAFVFAWPIPWKSPACALIRSTRSVCPQENSAPRPTHVPIRASSVQYVDRTERILVSSERIDPMNPARPGGWCATAPPTSA
jgi:hypothetical protein